MSSSESFNSFFRIWIPFISFSSLIAMARTSKTMLNNSHESGQTYLVPDLRGNVFSLSPLIMFAVCLSYMAFTMLLWAPSMPISWSVFLINECWILLKNFSASIEMIILILSSKLLIWCITLFDLCILKNLYILGINPTWQWCVSFLMCCWK